jgi:hypothetical protein
MEQIDDKTHSVKAQTKAGFISWGSAFVIDAVPVNENTTRVTVVAQRTVTPVTAIKH